VDIHFAAVVRADLARG